MKDIGDIRYSELRFTVAMKEDSKLPRYKASAIRGGMGDMLLNEFCIQEDILRDNKSECKSCGFYEDCPAQSIMYPKMGIIPDFMSERESVGYIVDCPDQREEIGKNEELNFTLLLFGKNILYLSMYLNAIYRLGIAGIGKYKAGFEVVNIRNMYGKKILDDGNIIKSNYAISTLSDYINWRLSVLNSEHDTGEMYRIRTRSPLSLKKNGEFVPEPDLDTFFKALLRRIYIMSCFEGIEKEFERNVDEYCKDIEITGSSFKKVGIARYSGHKETKIILNGVVGDMTIDLSNSSNKEKILHKLLMGELLHVGNNTTFGFGKIRIETIK